MCICLSVCLSVRVSARSDWLAEIRPRLQQGLCFYVYRESPLPLHGLYRRNTRYLYNSIGIVVSVPACQAQDRRFNSRSSLNVSIGFSRRAMHRETIPDTKNVIAQLNAIKLSFKLNIQRKKTTKA